MTVYIEIEIGNPFERYEMLINNLFYDEIRNYILDYSKTLLLMRNK